jgi:hypothetical protein
VPVLYEARHRGAYTCRMSVVGDLPTHVEAEGVDMQTEAGVVHPPHEFLLVGDFDFTISTNKSAAHSES